MLSGWGILISFWSVLVFSPTWRFRVEIWRGVLAWRGVIITVIIIISTELLALCDGYLGWVWRAGLVAGLRVGQAFGVLLPPGFGVSSSSSQVPRHPTSICDAGFNVS